MQRCLFFLLATLFTAALVHAAEPPKPDRVDYTSFEGKKVELFAWRGKHMAFLTKREDLDPKLMAELCTTFDKI